MTSIPRASYIDTGDTIPDFTADSSLGALSLYQAIDGGWSLVSTHPRAFTPICSTEIVSEARRSAELHRRGIRTVTISEGTPDENRRWAQDLSAHAGVTIGFPIVADTDRSLGRLLGTLRITPDGEEMLSRTTFIVDPDRIVRWRTTYPSGVGRGLDEIIRVLDALHALDRDHVVTPADWREGEPVLVFGDIELFNGDGVYEPVASADDTGSGQFSGLADLPYVKLWKKAETEVAQARPSDADSHR